MDYFTLFGLPARYQLDTQALSLRFQDLQRQYHPDKFASGSQAEQLAAVQQSATINQAWQTLASSVNARGIFAFFARF
ncbi:co-chaperone HscB [Escherichia coli]|uniref:Co-chaperone protein HscB n=1 Tax=Escherichia coli TaxID=562 RepID=A0A376SCR0_ECOLX|nr:co-chaperone HscB [Escherichia coli]